jgi:hypothetical protein
MNKKDVYDIVEVLKEDKLKDVSVVFIDFAKAYDSVNH